MDKSQEVVLGPPGCGKATYLLGVVERELAAGTRPERVGYFSYRDWETDRKSTRLNSSHSAKSRMPSSA